MIAMNVGQQQCVDLVGTIAGCGERFGQSAAVWHPSSGWRSSDLGNGGCPVNHRDGVPGCPVLP